MIQIEPVTRGTSTSAETQDVKSPRAELCPGLFVNHRKVRYGVRTNSQGGDLAWTMCCGMASAAAAKTRVANSCEAWRRAASGWLRLRRCPPARRKKQCSRRGEIKHRRQAAGSQRRSP